MTPCISNEQLEQLKILRKQSADAAIIICKCVNEYLNSGPNMKQYAAVAGIFNLTHTMFMFPYSNFSFMFGNLLIMSIFYLFPQLN